MILVNLLVVHGEGAQSMHCYIIIRNHRITDLFYRTSKTILAYNNMYVYIREYIYSEKIFCNWLTTFLA